MKRFYLALILLLGCIAWSCQGLALQNDAAYDADVDVRLTVDQSVFYAHAFRCELTIQYENLTLYNPYIKAAYHIYGADGQLLLFEGNRMSAVADENGVSKISFDIDVSQPLNENGGAPIEVVFDLVDEMNAFWFSDDAQLNMPVDTVHVEPNGLKETWRLLYTASKNHTFIFAANLVIFICFVVIGGTIIKNRKKIF